MRKPELAAAIAEQADISKEKANEVLNAVLDQITDSVAKKESVTLVGFGTFEARARAARTGKNPRLAKASRSRPATPLHSNRVRH